MMSFRERGSGLPEVGGVGTGVVESLPSRWDGRGQS